MKNPLAFFSRKNLETSFGIVIDRFPLPGILIALITGFFFYLVNNQPDSPASLRIVFSLIATFFLSVGVSLFLEWKKIAHKQLWHIAPLLYGILFYVTMNPITDDWMIDSVTYFILHLVGFIGFSFFAPYCMNLFYKKEQTIEYTNYFSRMAWACLMSDIVWGALVALGFIAITSVVELFDLHNVIQEDKLYGNWVVIALSLVAPLYYLMHIPKVKDIQKKTYDVNRFFSFLIRYIATPFIGLYFVILYAYSAKVLLNFQDWPKGMISWMVIGFSTFGYLTYIFSKPYELESRIIGVFRKFFPYVVPAQVLMLAYAIYLRIAQYDLTMNRYFVVIFGFWLALISVYYIMSQRKSLTVIASSLTAIALIISVGPWSVYRLPLVRQYDRLVTNLETTGMLRDGVITKKSGPLDAALENEIYSGIQYICSYSHCEKIKSLFADELAKKEAEYEKKWNAEEYNTWSPYPGMSSWEIVNEVATMLGISYRYGLERESKYISLGGKFAYDETAIFPMDTTGFNKILRVYHKNNGMTGNKQYISIDPDKEVLTLHGYGTDKNISLKSFNDTLRSKYTISDTNLGADELTTTLQSEGTTIKIILQSYGFRNPNFTPGENGDEYLNISGYALIKG